MILIGSNLLLIALDSIFALSNVAINKPAYMSSAGHGFYAALVVDGNINGGSYALLDFNESPADSWFVVDLMRSYSIKSVYVYNRKCFDCTNALDHFLVGLNNDFKPNLNTTLTGTYTLCGQYQYKAMPAGRPMKVPCRDEEKLYRFVIIQQDINSVSENQIMGLSEIEVYAEEHFGQNYIGCFKLFLEIVEVAWMNLEDCIRHCLSNNALFAAVKLDKCKCGNNLAWTIPSEKCYVGCKDYVLCGGETAYAVYMVRKPLIPRLSACFNDVFKVNHTSVILNGRLKIVSCIAACSKDTLNYAKIKNKVECICGSSMELEKWKSINREPVLPCLRTCAKRPDKKCWNPEKIRIYLTCYDDILRKTCQDMYHCKFPFRHNSTGHCYKYLCQPGWKGQLCNLRECSVNNGNCGKQHICSEMTLGLHIVSECICGTGHYKRHIYDSCMDIDECKSNSHKCQLPIYLCVNTPGSFECVANVKLNYIKTLENKALLDCNNNTCPQPSQVCTRVYEEYFCHCKSGFEYVNISYCEDINECTQSNRTCTREASICINSLGSYQCQCRGGYVERGDNTCIEASRLAHDSYSWNEEVLIAASGVFASIFIVITILLARVIFIQKRALRRIQMSLSLITRQESLNTP